MSEAATHLRKVKTEFENHGIRNEVQIAEHVAFLLLIREDWPQARTQTGTVISTVLSNKYEQLQREHVSLRLPQPPPAGKWGTSTLSDLINNLQQSIQESPYSQDLGDFFQREIRYELLKGTTGSQYPTPHHVASFIAALGTRATTGKVFDPTVGSAGILAAVLK